jgi:hypothetical protein
MHLSSSQAVSSFVALEPQPLIALAAVSKELARHLSHLRNRQTQMRDQSLGPGRLGAHPRNLGVAGAPIS